MDKEKLKLLLRGHKWRDNLFVYRTAGSTNDLLKKKARAGAPEGTVVIADTQTAGRGRMGRSFYSAPDAGLYYSILLRPDAEKPLMSLTARAAVCAAEAVRTVCNVRPQVKWVNDLVMNGRKTGGILTELLHLPDGVAAIVGIGINCGEKREDFPPELRETAGSVFSETGLKPDREALAAELTRELSGIWEEEKPEEYRKLCVNLGKPVKILSPDGEREAQALDVTDAGALIVKYPDGSTEEIFSGEVSVRGMYGYL